MLSKTVSGLDSLSYHCTNLSNRTGKLFNGRIQMWREVCKPPFLADLICEQPLRDKEICSRNGQTIK